MKGIVSLLDTESEHRVERLGQELELTQGLKGVQLTPLPHFSWQLAENYDGEGVRALLDELARDILPFDVRTSGLGLFTGEQPTLYLPLVKDRMLLEIHALLWQSFEELTETPHPHYHPDVWTPHITLAYRDLGKDVISRLVETMTSLPLNWEITVETLALICQEGGGARLEYSVNLTD